MQDNLKDLKDAIIYTTQNSKAENSVELFQELLTLLYCTGYKDGQHYIYEKEDEQGE